MDGEDVFHETILLLTHDARCAEAMDEQEIIADFVRRFRMVRFQTVCDERQRRIVPIEDCFGIIDQEAQMTE